MKLLITILITFFFSNSLWASSKVKIALIISLDAKEGKAFFNGTKYDVNQRIEKEFQKHFEPSDFEIEIVRDANLEAVWKTLHDTSVQGIFYVGHANSEAKISNGGPLASASIIADKNMFNIKNVFQSVHSNLRYLAFLSCNSEGIIQKFIDKNYYSNAPGLKIKSFDKNVELKAGLSELIYNEDNQLVKRLSYDELFPSAGPCDGLESQTDSALSECKIRAVKSQILKMNPDILKNTFAASKLNSNFIIARTIPYDGNQEAVLPTLIMIGERVIGFFEKAKLGQSQSITANITNEELKNKSLITIESGAPSTMLKSKIIMGELEVQSFKNYCQVDGLRNSKGELLGVGKNIYRLECY